MTSVDKRIPFHIAIDPPEGGVRERSYTKCEDVRSIDTSQRLINRWGLVSESTKAIVNDRLRIVMSL